MTESVYSYVYENGRTYQAYRPEAYVSSLPDHRPDAPELTDLSYFRMTRKSKVRDANLFIIYDRVTNDPPDRLDMLHHIFCLSQNGELCRTQLENPQKILDIGTGTGIWAIDSTSFGEFPCFHGHN